MKRLIIILSFGAIAVLPALASASTVHGCRYPPNTSNLGPRNNREMIGYGVSVRNMSCSAALRAISNGYLVENGSPLHTRGFRCSVITKRYASGGRFILGATIRCVCGPRAFRFSWAP